MIPNQHETKVPDVVTVTDNTNNPLELVLKHYELAESKDFEKILIENEPQVINHRDKMYSECKQNGTNSNSNDDVRLKVIFSVIEYTYLNIKPPNKYTKDTDIKHFKEVSALCIKFWNDINVNKHKTSSVPITLIIAGWFHDIERFIPSIKCEYLPETVDKYRKQIIHGVASAKTALVLLKKAPLTAIELNRIYQLISYHDIPDPYTNIAILTNNVFVGIHKNSPLAYELEILQNADCFAFFQSTISLFIEYKSNKNTKTWIWERIFINAKRLKTMYLKKEAIKYINQLSNDLKSKIQINVSQLNSIIV